MSRPSTRSRRSTRVPTIHQQAYSAQVYAGRNATKEDIVRLHPANPPKGLQAEFNAPRKAFVAQRNPYYPPSSEALAPPAPLDDPNYRYDDYIPPSAGSIAVHVRRTHRSVT